MSITGVGDIEEKKELGKNPEDANIKRLILELELAQKEHKKWHEQADKVVKRYMDEDRTSEDEGERRFGILWSNVQTLQPALYARTPKPEVERRFKLRDPVSRLASTVLERAISYNIECVDFDLVAKQCRDDYLIPGRGQAWVKYEPTVKEAPDPVTGLPVQQIVYQEVGLEYVPWKDFTHDKSRVWQEVNIVGRAHYYTRAQLKENFGEEIGGEVPLDFSTEASDADKESSELFKKAKVWELWVKDERMVYFVSTKYPKRALKAMKDPLGLKNFFPCPRPLTATTTTDSIIPKPDYCFYQDQATMLDDLTHRIGLLTEAMKVVGAYDKKFTELGNILNSGDNTMVPVDQYGLLAERGGIKGIMEFAPVQQVAETLRRLMEIREQVKRDLYEVTGMSDIIRGNSNPNETATAQQIKGQFATLRLSDRQKEFQRFLRDIIALIGEIIAEKFEPHVLAIVGGVDTMSQEEQQLFPDAVKLLQDDAQRGFKIDIETDSTIAIDENMERTQRTEWLQAMGQFMTQILPIAQQVPQLLPPVAEMMLFTSRTFRAGRSLEATFETAFEQITQVVQQNMAKQQQAEGQPPPPDPNKVLEIQAKATAAQGELAVKREKNTGELMLAREKAAAELELEEAKTLHDMELQRDRQMGQFQLMAAKQTMQQPPPA